MFHNNFVINFLFFKIRLVFSHSQISITKTKRLLSFKKYLKVELTVPAQVSKIEYEKQNYDQTGHEKEIIRY